MRLFYPPVGARYINRQVLGIFLVALSILLSIALGDRLIQFLEKAAAGNIPADRVFYIVLLRMPELIQVVLPFALYIGLLMGLGRLYSSQEMSVLRSGGGGSSGSGGEVGGEGEGECFNPQKSSLGLHFSLSL